MARSTGKPLARTREYVDIVRKGWWLASGWTYEGATYRISGRGAALVWVSRCGRPSGPIRDDIPIFLGAQGAERTSRWPRRSATVGSPHSSGRS